MFFSFKKTQIGYLCASSIENVESEDRLYFKLKTMPRRKSKGSVKPLREHSNNTPNRSKREDPKQSQQEDTLIEAAPVSGIVGIKSLLDDDQTNTPAADFSSDTAALYDELDNFRQRWRRELGVTKPAAEISITTSQQSVVNPPGRKQDYDEISIKENINASSSNESNPYDRSKKSDRGLDEQETYAEAKKLFLQAVELEQDEMHHESIRYYKQAMHLYPDIEKQIFREQCEASARAAANEKSNAPKNIVSTETKQEGVDQVDEENKIELIERIREAHYEANQMKYYGHCKPQYKPKQNSIHISDLPREMLVHIFRFIVGQELDLSSLESAGLVCRGFFLLSRDQSLWRRICFSTWGKETLPWTPKKLNEQIFEDSGDREVVDWRQMYLERPRVNFDGVYISRTRYIRQGDTGFQDVTYRPFHVIRYYRYLRFFPDKRVLVLTTNEEPDKIVPIFRHALHAKQFSSELSILEGTYEFTGPNKLYITAEKDCRLTMNSSQSQRRQAHLNWSRQTPLTQKFSLRFELRTAENKPYRNNVLKWLEYTILSRLETGQEVTDFDLSPDTFPNLIFSRVKRFNLRLSIPLADC